MMAVSGGWSAQPDGAVMRRLFAVLGLVGLASSALAADYDPPILRGSDIFVPAYPTYRNWEGFYFGGQLSYGNAQADFSQSTPPWFTIPLRDLTFADESGAANIQVLGAVETGAAGAGGFVGHNWQFDQAVIGVEFNYIHSNFDLIAPNFPISRLTGTLSNGHPYAFTLNGAGNLHMTDIGELRARFGYAMDSFMPYLTIGLAGGRADMSVTVSCVCQELTNNPTPPPAQIVDADFSFTNGTQKNGAYMWGFSGGGGLEWALTQNLFARGDYEYIQWSPIAKITSHLNIVHLGLGVRF